MRARLTALALTAGVYGLAFVLAAALAGGAVALVVTTGRGVYLAGVGVAGAWAIAKAMWPKPFLGDAPGVLLDPRSAPTLHVLVRNAARAAGVTPPDEIRVDLEPNAGALRHHGRNVVVLGLPYVAALDREALRSVVAHELAHLHHDVSRVDRLLLSARIALGRAIEDAGWLRAPFRWYARRFLVATAGLSRDAERRADALAARVVGDEACARALGGGRAAGSVWPAFWVASVRPALEAGLRPSLAVGFRAALAGAEAPSAASDDAGVAADAFATHPELRERLEAVGHRGAPPWAEGGDDALVAEVETAEVALLAAIAGFEAVAQLRPVEAVEPVVAIDHASPAPEPAPRSTEAADALSGAAFSVALASGRAGRVKAAGMLGLLSVTLLPFAAIFAWFALMSPDAPSAGARVLALVVLCGPCLVAFWWFARRYVGAFRGDGTLAVEGDSLVIELPRGLREPVRVPARDVVALSVDASAGTARFPVMPESPWARPLEGGAGPLGFLWTAKHGPSMPVLSAEPGVPDVALLLESPITLPATRGRTLHGFRAGDELGGLMLRVERPAELAAHLAAAGVPAQLHERDFARESEDAEAAIAA